MSLREIREALEPFAKIGCLLEGGFGPALFKDEQAFKSGCAWSEGGETRTLTFGDFRRARRALDLLASMESDESLRTALKRALCAEACAEFGDPPCWEIAPNDWDSDEHEACNCGALATVTARAALASLFEEKQK